MRNFYLFLLLVFMAGSISAQTPTVSASSVTLKYCETTSSTVHLPVRKSNLPITYDGFTFTTLGSFERKLVNARGCDSIVTYIVETSTEGMLSGKFTVDASGRQIQFSKGNLMYRASNGTAYPNAGSLSHQTATGRAAGEWKFGETQYSACGNVAANYKPSATQTDWMDVFSAGSSGYQYVPTNRSSNYGTDSFAGTNHDWGVFNAIQGGGNFPGLWRAITKAEFNYIFYSRPNHAQKYSWATVAGVKGFIILPDQWTLPSGGHFTANQNTSSLTYTASQWAAMEANGAVFLVIDYYSQEASANNMYGGESFYRTSVGGSIDLYSYKYDEGFNGDGDDACHVRLVCDVEQ